MVEPVVGKRNSGKYIGIAEIAFVFYTCDHVVLEIQFRRVELAFHVRKRGNLVGGEIHHGKVCEITERLREGGQAVVVAVKHLERPGCGPGGHLGDSFPDIILFD